ncbi:MAG: hypothetical protein LBG59_02525 [Candidatus Peribacteria bacterium]|nr:hypothetical protein [Candidatus Peribacteria bacterium]
MNTSLKKDLYGILQKEKDVDETIAIQDVFSEEKIDFIIDTLRNVEYAEAYTYFEKHFRIYEKQFLE